MTTKWIRLYWFIYWWNLQSIFQSQSWQYCNNNNNEQTGHPNSHLDNLSMDVNLENTGLQFFFHYLSMFFIFFIIHAMALMMLILSFSRSLWPVDNDDDPFLFRFFHIVLTRFRSYWKMNFKWKKLLRLHLSVDEVGRKKSLSQILTNNVNWILCDKNIERKRQKLFIQHRDLSSVYILGS